MIRQDDRIGKEKEAGSHDLDLFDFSLDDEELETGSEEGASSGTATGGAGVPRAFRGWKVVGLLALTTFLVAVAMGHVWVRLRIVRLGYELSRESAQTSRLERLLQKLSVEHSLLRNPKRIEELARRRLGLRGPKPGEVRLIRQGSGLFGLKVEEGT